jgi:dolichol-phosphate mannosyltransferase
MSTRKTLIFIPTYNEAENVRMIYDQIKALDLDTDLLFCDDNSPDGTGRIIDEICHRDHRVFVIHREGKLGIGTAHRQGIDWAYANGYQQLITMDCDFSHSPSYIKEFIGLSGQGDVVVGSRYMEEGSLREWNLFRKVLTHTGHFLTDTLLKMPYDATGAFRLYNLDHIPQGIFHLPRSEGYSFFFESLYILMLNGIAIKEFPIALPARTYGHSKMTLKAAYRSFMYLMTIYGVTLFKRHEFIYADIELTRQFKATSQAYVKQGQLNSVQVEQDWEAYWKKDRGSINLLYDAIASFYRFCIIKRALNHFIWKTFPPGSHLLHAGCGSGQVDVDISKEYKVYALDISSSALKIYKKYNPGVYELLWADIFHLPLKDAQVDGVYNLGVMEHFTAAEIQQILSEFFRVLKSGGRAVIFWPPEFGLATRFLSAADHLLKNVLRSKVKLYPDEITRIKSKEHMVGTFELAGFEVKEYYFGIKDLWTQCVVVAVKGE